MKALILAGMSAAALVVAGAGTAGHAAGMNETNGTSSSMSNGSTSSGMARQGGQAAVKQAQEKLKTAGLYQGQVDGIDGPQTRQALQQFQQQNGLQPTGRLDHETLAKLNQSSMGSGSSSTTPESTSGQSGGATGANPNGANPSGTNPNSGGGMR
ncbi:MAG TPA: peptidoglycan-binding domain-containing protein [Candidatus Saccharimonadales bacterium]|nr:peptidoglycan-binding domain-containing protein [Candidatus Saccharimonadales bacterium]